MTEHLHLKDSYLSEFDAAVCGVDMDGKCVLLDRTAFYPAGGGQPSDTGTLVRKSDGSVFNVLSVRKSEGEVWHELDKPGLKAGDSVHGKIDWERRYRLMRMHTAAHLLAAILNSEHGALITGNQLNTDKSRMDFSLDRFDRGILEAVTKKANELISQKVEVKTYFLPREEALKIPNVVKLAAALGGEESKRFPASAELRIVEIVGLDKQLDGGTHVANLREIGSIEIVSMENKGKSNRRVYFTVKP